MAKHIRPDESSLLDLLLCPSPQVEGIRAREQARLTSTLALQLLIACCAALIYLGLRREPGFGTLALMVLLMLGLYVLSRSRWHRLAAALLTLSSALASWYLNQYAFQLNPPRPGLGLIGMVIPTLLAVLLFEWPVQVLAMLVLAANGIFYSLYAPETPAAALTGIVLLAGSMVIAGNLRRRRITEHYETSSRALASSEERLRSIVESETAYVVRGDLQGRYTYINPRVQQRFAWMGKDLIGQPATATIIPEDHARAAEAVAACLKEPGKPVQVRLRKPTPEGQPYWTLWEFVAVRDSKGQPVEIQSIGIDIDEQVQAEEALRAEHALLNAVFQTSVGAITVLNRQGEIIFANEGAERILGLSRDELTGHHYSDGRFLHSTFEGAPWPEGMQPFEQVLRSGSPVFDIRQAVEWPDGRRKYLSINGAPLRDAQGEIGQVVFLVTDVSAAYLADQELARYRAGLEKLVEERTIQLAAANEQLQALGKLKDEFVSNVSHELRTPIASLKLYHHLLGERPERREAYLNTLGRETARLEQIVEDLLKLSRLDQGHTPLNLQAIDLNDMLNTYIEDRRLLAEQLGLSIWLDLAADLPTIQADPNLLGQVLSTLLTNAYSYTPAGGRIALQSRIDREQSQVGISLTNSGPAIPAQDLPHIFTRFYRGEAGKRSRLPGTGLGLSIAQEIVTLHGGRIEVESGTIDAETGVCFTAWLPFTAPGKATQRITARRDSSR